MPKTCSRFCLFLISALAACGGKEATKPVVDTAGPDLTNVVARVAVYRTRTSLTVGGTVEFTVEVSNAAGTVLSGKTITWSSSRPDVATVVAGVVTGEGVGTAVITATCEGRTENVTVTVNAPILINLISDAGGDLGGGKTYTYTKTNAQISGSASLASVQFSIGSDNSWFGFFDVPTGDYLRPGTFVQTERFAGSGSPRVAWQWDNIGCNGETGFFTIDSLAWTAGAGSKLIAIDLRFEHHCNAQTPALRGTIHWRDDDPTLPPGPVFPVPTNLWRPPAGSTPPSGDFVYVESDSGDFIGRGSSNLYQSGLVIFGSGAEARAVVRVTGQHEGQFVGMHTITRLQPGYYGSLPSAVRGAVEWIGYNRTCGRRTGWFAVDRINYTGNMLSAIELRFEQYCDNTVAALRGAVRWGF